MCDSDNHHIQKFTSEAEGQFVTSVGAVHEGDCVSMFGSRGGVEFLTCFGEEGEGTAQFTHPTLLTVDHLGVLCVWTTWGCYI